MLRKQYFSIRISKVLMMHDEIFGNSNRFLELTPEINAGAELIAGANIERLRNLLPQRVRMEFSNLSTVESTNDNLSTIQSKYGFPRPKGACSAKVQRSRSTRTCTWQWSQAIVQSIQSLNRIGTKISKTGINLPNNKTGGKVPSQGQAVKLM